MSPNLHVAFDIPGLSELTYLNLEASPARTGMRVRVPLGARKAIGFVIAETEEPPDPAFALKAILEVLDTEPAFGQRELKLARWMASMYLCSVGEALATMLGSATIKKRTDSTEESSIEAADFGIDPHSHTMSEPQTRAVESICSGRGRMYYLFGLTGTGKTEVFLQAASRYIQEGLGVIYLVPEISLTSQVVEAARARFGAQCAVLHSRLAPAIRRAEWKRIAQGQAKLVIGARSAIFAPVEKLGLVIIDEEHDSSYKAGSAPRYHARQVAYKRLALEGCTLVMGSATPSLEAWKLMNEGSIEKLTLTKRLSGGAPATITVVDLRAEQGPISRMLAHSVLQSKAMGMQSILFLNRRGFSHFFHCPSCGYELICKNCSVALTFHKDKGVLICHYCGYRRPPPTTCPECGNIDIEWLGFGTQAVEAAAARTFPNMTIARIDTDSTSRKGVLEKTITDFRAGKIDILLGTQMVAKGLNFPGVRTVGIILADSSLGLPDFRALERTFALIVQVAGRAGRFRNDGEVILQTYKPAHPVITYASHIDIENWYQAETKDRKAQAFPPWTRLVRIIIRSTNASTLTRVAASIAQEYQALLPATVELLGPAECPLGLIAGTYRRQILLRAHELGPMVRMLHKWRSTWKSPYGIRLEIDVDPQSMM